MIRTDERTCCGCKACESTCPMHCISFTKNNNGFLLPIVDASVCIRCGICERTCPVAGKLERNNVLKVYAAYGVSKEVINSASGGVFYEIAKDFISAGGIVFGAAYDKNLYLHIESANSIDMLYGLQGSKYFQADTSDSYKKVREYLDKGLKVLYSGTPCHIAGLRQTLRKNNIDNLVTVEIICHGTPSSKMFHDYINWRSSKKGKRVSAFQFRTKKMLGHDFQCLIKYEDGSTEIISGFKDPYYKKFMEGTSNREICYDCPFNRKERVADITLGDFWNIQDLDIHFGGSERVSVVLINSVRGLHIWQDLAGKIITHETTLDIALKGNSSLSGISYRPSKYVPYGEVKDPIRFWNESLKESRNWKKEIFNMLPPLIRREIKKFIR